MEFRSDGQSRRGGVNVAGSRRSVARVGGTGGLQVAKASGSDWIGVRALVRVKWSLVLPLPLVFCQTALIPCFTCSPSTEFVLELRSCPLRRSKFILPINNNIHIFEDLIYIW